MEASPKNVALVRTLRERGVFLDIEPARWVFQNGITMIHCADCDQREDLTAHAERLLRDNGCPTRIQPLSLNGGAFGISVNSPINPGDHRGRTFLTDILGTRRLKNIHAVVIYGHAPCGAMRDANVHLDESLRLLMEAEARIKEEAPTMDVRALFHMDWDGARKRTYFVSHRAWEAWVGTNGHARVADGMHLGEARPG